MILLDMDSQSLFQKSKRKVFVSYDHYRDAVAFEEFQRLFASLYEITRDNSLEREIDSTDGEAFVKYLREEELKDWGCMIVICGTHTHLDKFVDWEIKSGLDQKMGLIGILLPSNPRDTKDVPLLPTRLQKNFDGGFAVICEWDGLISTQVDLTQRMIFAMDRDVDLIHNTEPLQENS